MQLYLNTFLAAVLLLNLLALGTGRLPTVIRLVTLQGGLIGLLPLLIHSPWRAESVALAIATLLTKGILIPSILMRAMREVQIRKEIEPLIGILPSMLLGALGTGLSLLFASKLPLVHGQENSLLVPASLATVLTGCIFLTSRMKAVSQVVGYLILENGIFIFGLLMLEAMPFMVEMGLLLDLVVCIFVSGIILNHIKDTFDSLDTRVLTALKEDTSWPQKIVLLFFPLFLALLCWVIPSRKIRSYLLPLGGIVHLALSVYGFFIPAVNPLSPYLGLDAPARLVLPGVSLLFFICSIYAVGYLREHANRSNRVFCSSMLAFLSMMTLVAYARHLGLMWVAVEATTLSTAPLIYFNYNPKSIEATWKYLLICSVGIALALLGTFFLAYASMGDETSTSLFMADLLVNAPHLSKPWLHAAFILLLVGYGTKMGLAPMHTWKPDAYGEASGLVGALLAGGLTQCAFLAVFRIFWICRAAGEGLYAGRFLIIMGLLSMAMAAAFIIHQRDFKRMLAYSSVEHMGILSLGLGLGGISTYGALLHLINNGLTKGLLFLAAGNIAHAYGGKTLENVRGAIRRLPLSGTMFLLGFIAITGSPPFGPFVSEFLILNGTFARGYLWVGALYLLFLLVVFMGMGGTVLAVVQGKATKPAEGSGTAYHDSLWSGIPLIFLALLILLLGIYIPGALNEKVMAASHCLEQLYE